MVFLMNYLKKVFAYLVDQIFGTAALGVLPAEQLLPWATRIGGRYMGPERADEFGARNAADGELLVRVSPTKIVSNAGATAYE